MYGKFVLLRVGANPCTIKPMEAKLPKQLGWLATSLAWIASVFPNVWVVILTSVAATSVLIFTVGIRWLESPALHSAILVFLAVLWTLIGIIWLRERRKPVEIFPLRDYRYGLTFQGIVPTLDLNNDDGALQMGIAFQNYSPGPLRYEVEKFAVWIDTRSLPETDNSFIPIFMPRGAGRTSNGRPFKKMHIKEFLGRRCEGTLSFSIAYGDVDDSRPSRRLKMSFTTYFVFPSDEAVINNGMPPPFGFNAIITKESDELIVYPD